MNKNELKEKLYREIDRRKEELIGLGIQLWKNPEPDSQTHAAHTIPFHWQDENEAFVEPAKVLAADAVISFSATPMTPGGSPGSSPVSPNRDIWTSSIPSSRMRLSGIPRKNKLTERNQIPS